MLSQFVRVNTKTKKSVLDFGQFCPNFKTDRTKWKLCTARGK
jgi:hypothetical protein